MAKFLSRGKLCASRTGRQPAFPFREQIADIKEKTAALLLALPLVPGLGVFAASNNETVTAILSRELRICYHGVEQHFTDANGNPVYPVSRSDTTYLPDAPSAADFGRRSKVKKTKGGALLGPHP